MIPVISVVGRSKAGKTTLVVKLIKELKHRGYRVAIIKHDVHGFEIDHPGKDTWLHAEAGADIVTISSADKIAMIEKLQEEKDLDQIISKISNVDIIITEGYKGAAKPKIEVFRLPRSEELFSNSKDLIALATNTPLNVGVPEFEMNDSFGLVNMIEDLFLKKHIIKE